MGRAVEAVGVILMFVGAGGVIETLTPVSLGWAAVKYVEAAGDHLLLVNLAVAATGLALAGLGSRLQRETV